LPAVPRAKWSASACRPAHQLARQVRHEITSKGQKANIGAVVALHADIDPYKDEDRDLGRQRVMRMLAQELPAGIPGSPSVINDSGNGFNAFWLLRAPVLMDGDTGEAEAVEKHNRGLQAAFGGDAVADISRMMRLPWSINLPTRRSAGWG
jgi:hypothetical protein